MKRTNVGFDKILVECLILVVFCNFCHCFLCDNQNKFNTTVLCEDCCIKLNHATFQILQLRYIFQAQSTQAHVRHSMEQRRHPAVITGNADIRGRKQAISDSKRPDLHRFDINLTDSIHRFDFDWMQLWTLCLSDSNLDWNKGVWGCLWWRHFQKQSREIITRRIRVECNFRQSSPSSF